jgi:hypothetical protein
VIALALIVACSDGSDADRDRPDAGVGEEPTTVARPTRTSTAAPPPTDPPELPTGLSWALDFPDPYLLATADGYLAFGTTSGLIQVQRLEADDHGRWSGPEEAPVAEPAWATPNSSWAPAVLAVEAGYLLYYTVQVAGTDRHCISVAHAERPQGPYRDESTSSFLCPMDTGGAIDPSPFTDTNGSLHLLWKNDGVTLRTESSIWSQPLSADGRSLSGSATVLIATDQPWEFPHVEAPSMVLVDGTYWLAYSANWWNQAAYGVGLARCQSVVGPCTKPYDGPVLTSAPARYGPGGAEFFLDASGRTLMAYHAWMDEPGYPGHRALHITAIDFRTNPPTIEAT